MSKKKRKAINKRKRRGMNAKKNQAMSEMDRRAIVWDIIERVAFQPNSDKECSTWLRVYAKTLHKLWEVDPVQQNFGYSHIFDIPFLNMKCDCNIESVKKYSISLMDLSADDNCWHCHIDPKYFSYACLYSSSADYPHQQLNELEKDVETVLDGMLFHPRCHTHIDEIGVQSIQLDLDIGGLSSHEVRIGGGIDNPYVFLFHLRYQCCLVADPARQKEKRRLIELFYHSIKDKVQNVSARDLCDFG